MEEVQQGGYGHDSSAGSNEAQDGTDREANNERLKDDQCDSPGLGRFLIDQSR
jgi:hypothetical protein